MNVTQQRQYLQIRYLIIEKSVCTVALRQSAVSSIPVSRSPPDVASIVSTVLVVLVAFRAWAFADLREHTSSSRALILVAELASLVTR